MLHRLFLEHPHSVGEGYWQHQRKAFMFGASMVSSGMACLIHALIPALFQKTGSSTVARLHDVMVVNRTRRAEQGPPGGSPLRRNRLLID